MTMRRILIWAALGGSAVGAVVVGVAAGFFLKEPPGTGPRVSGPMPCAMYVWQREWNAPVRAAVRTVPAWVSGLAPLGVEVTWEADGLPRAVWPDVDFEALRLAGPTTSAVLRVGPRTPTVASGEALIGITRELLRRFQEGGVAPVELQVDFDCAESQLAAYRTWLATLRAAVAPVVVRPTVLPSWLAHREFAALARESGEYILQVHATELPRIDSQETALCDADRAHRWVEQAGRLGVPFRVALPTYTYLVGFSPEGKLLAIVAEGEERVWPTGTVVRTFRPEASDLAKLISGWQDNRPAALRGILWYRLPVSTDTRNWRWPTLTAVATGRVPSQLLEVEKSGSSPVDIALVNAGESEAALPEEIVVRSRESGVEADGVGGYEAESRGHETIFRRSPELATVRLAPGRRHPLGWLRTTSEIEIYVQ